MAYEKSLMERIASGGDDIYNIEVDPQRALQSIMDHLGKMLNTRQGSVVTLLDYGIPDLNDMVSRFPDGLIELRQAIRNSLEKYEPRLQRVQVSHVKDEENPMNLRFEITAQLLIGDKRTPISFRTILRDSGEVDVRR